MERYQEEHHGPILYSTGKGGPSNSKSWARHKAGS